MEKRHVISGRVDGYTKDEDFRGVDAVHVTICTGMPKRIGISFAAVRLHVTFVIIALGASDLVRSTHSEDISGGLFPHEGLTTPIWP